MSENTPLVSLIIPTYNRASTIRRAIDSALGQTYTNLELVIVDDGSKDQSLDIISSYTDNRIRIVKHPVNKGVTAAKNTGLEHMKGEWFSMLDSDDEIIPEAIETMMQIPLKVDRDVTAITCNCQNSVTGELTGSGPDRDQYLDVPTLMTKCKGEFWGLTKSSLLQGDRFNENIKGWESILWYKIDDRAKRYYIHKPLRIYHTEGDDRVSNAVYKPEKELALYEQFSFETAFLDKLAKYRPADYVSLCKTGLVISSAFRKKQVAAIYFDRLKAMPAGPATGIFMQILGTPYGASAYLSLRKLKSGMRRMFHLF